MSEHVTTQRLFFALWPEQAVRAQLAALLPQLAAGGDRGGRMVAAENLHLTLAFAGNVDGGARACLEAWADTISVPCFDLVLDRLAYWSRPRVVWLGPAAWPEELDTLATALAGGMRHCGLPPERHPYTPHVTLLRKARSLPEPPSGLPICWPVRGFVLCESRSGPGGVEYHVLRRWGSRVED